MPKPYHQTSPVQPAELHRLISRVQSVKKRNLLRGYLHKPTLTSDDIETIRKLNSTHDSAVIGAFLKGRRGMLEGPDRRKQRKRTAADIYSIVQFPSLDWRNEVAFSAGIINSMISDASDAL